jgi:hypothetical protein
MSNWTHVAAIFRVDSFLHEGKDFTKIFGKEVVLMTKKQYDNVFRSLKGE